MLRIVAVPLLFLLVGSALAVAQGHLPVRPGLIGLAVMLASAFVVRRHWRSLHVDRELGSPERALWHALASRALIAGQLLMSLGLIGPAMHLHSVAVHAMAVDSWTLVLGAIVSFYIARDPEPRSDERDNAFVARATRIAYATLIAQLSVVIVILSFGADFNLPAFSQPLIAHALIVCLMLASMVRSAVQLALYHFDQHTAFASV
ncbi:MAG TPA: hypothetical protein VK629_08235 [Steroidobacteraceae bacterium]|nr:hypothetical protein [Steroidobacteraceae bacterium]